MLSYRVAVFTNAVFAATGYAGLYRRAVRLRTEAGPSVRQAP